MDFLIVSDSYWPSLEAGGGQQASGPQLHPRAARRLDEYVAAFEMLKKPRKLKPVAQLGQVDLDLHFEDGSTRQFSTTPLLVRPALRDAMHMQ
jgi:hypothetical protein